MLSPCPCSRVRSVRIQVFRVSVNMMPTRISMRNACRPRLSFLVICLANRGISLEITCLVCRLFVPDQLTRACVVGAATLRCSSMLSNWMVRSRPVFRNQTHFVCPPAEMTDLLWRDQVRKHGAKNRMMGVIHTAHTFRVIPHQAAAVAELRAELAGSAMILHSHCCVIAFSWFEHILMTNSPKRRVGVLGRKTESVTAGMKRRNRWAWNGFWQ